MSQTPVWLFREKDRYTTVRRALEAATADLDWSRFRHIVVKPNLVSTTRLLAVTHPDALAAVLDVVRDATSAPVTVAEGTATQNTWLAFHRFGYVDLVKRYPNCQLLDLNTDTPRPLVALDRRWQPMVLQAAATVLEADLVISVGPPKTHDFVIVTASIKNLIMGTLISRFAPHPPRPEDVARDGAVRPLPVRLLKAARAAYEALPASLQALPLFEAPRFFFMAREPRSDKFRMHQSYALLNLNLFLMAWQGLLPNVSVLDGWEAMEGDGPTDGDPVPWRVTFAGRDPVAVDSLAATSMGYPLEEVGYLYYCHLAGLGQGDVAALDVRGNVDPSAIRRSFRPHRLIRNQRRWRDPRAEAYVRGLRDGRIRLPSPAEVAQAP